MRLEGKTALITGSGRNIGRATALALAKEGANIVVNARSNMEEAEAVAQEVRALGVGAIPVLADVADRAQVDDMVSKANAKFGKVDILINNAAIRPHGAFTESSMEDWERVRGVVLDGAIYCTHAVLPSMVENQFGRVLFFCGDGSFTGGTDRAFVSAAKTGLIGLSKSLALEFASDNIRVNIVSPGRIDTSRDLSWYPKENMRNTDGIPLGRLGLPEEIAAACLFLVTDDCGFITGQTLHINGGSHFG